jgi:hypothetical protein
MFFRNSNKNYAQVNECVYKSFYSPASPLGTIFSLSVHLFPPRLQVLCSGSLKKLIMSHATNQSSPSSISTCITALSNTSPFTCTTITLSLSGLFYPYQEYKL